VAAAEAHPTLLAKHKPQAVENGEFWHRSGICQTAILHASWRIIDFPIISLPL
jgi:hypothetical protein